MTATVGFVLTETLLGVLLQTSSGRAANLYSYASIILACLFCLLWVERSFDYFSTQMALVCTVGADFFLVYLPEREQLPAMLFFSAAQLLYFARIYMSDDHPLRKRWHLLSRGACTLAMLAVSLGVLGQRSDAVALISVFYYTQLFFNLVFACLSFKKHAWMAVGFILFLCCDTLVGLAFLDEYFVIPADSVIYQIIHPGFDLAWACYLPSQMLLSLSLLPTRWEKTRKRQSENKKKGLPNA